MYYIPVIIFSDKYTLVNKAEKVSIIMVLIFHWGESHSFNKPENKQDHVR